MVLLNRGVLFPLSAQDDLGSRVALHLPLHHLHQEVLDDPG